MKYLIGGFCLFLLAACSSDLGPIQNYGHEESNSSRYVFIIADDAKLIIHTEEIDFDKQTLELIREAFTLAHLNNFSNDETLNLKSDKGKYKWEDALFLQVPKSYGSFYWENVDVPKVEFQTYVISSKANLEEEDISYTIYNFIFHKVSNESGIYDFNLEDYVSRNTDVDGIRARLYGERTNIFFETELLQSEIRCFHNPYCSGKLNDIPDFIVEM